MICLFIVVGSISAIFIWQPNWLSSPVESEDSAEFCLEHGYIKKNCYQCNSKLVDKFKTALDWCNEHSLPESQCELCDPYAKFKAKGDWCKEHGVPESQCIKCNPKLAKKQPKFIDWCKEHNIAESQCTICNPDLKISLKSDWCQDHNVRDSECILCHPHLRKTMQNDSNIFCKHGFQEGNCYQCEPKLAEKFKAAGDWCGGHNVPESQCFPCNSGLQEKVNKRLAQNSQKDQPDKEWCEHGFEERNCYQCKPKLAEKFKATGDWCGGHNVPESQCFPCNPKLKDIVAERLTVSAVKPELLQNNSDIVVSLNTKASLPKSAFCGTHLLRIKFSRKEIASLIGIKIEPARKRVVKETLACNGEVMYNSSNLTRVASRFLGIVQKVNVRVGQKIKKDQILGIINSPNLGQLRIDIATKEKLFHNKKKIYYNIKKMLTLLAKNNISSSQATEKMKKLEIGLVKSSLLKKLAELELVQSELNRQKEMEKEGVGLKKNLVQSQKKFDSTYTSYVSLIEHTKVSAEREMIETQGQLNNALQNLGTNIKKISASKKPSEYIIRAPFDATVISVKTARGELVEYGKPLFVIADLSSMWIRLDIFEKDLPRLNSNQPVRFKTHAIKDASFEGKILWLGSEVDDKTRTVHVLAQVDNKDNLLRANMFGKAKILIHQNEKVIVVSKKAIQWEGCCHIVFVQLQNDLYAPRKIRLGYEGKDFYEIKAGLLAGEPVVTQGSFLLKTEILKSSIGAGCTD